MAKLNVTYPASEVTVGDVIYRKVDRKAQAGDIVKVLAGGLDITNGAFYLVERGRELYFRDDVGHARYRIEGRVGQHEVYTPVISASTADIPVDMSGQITFEGTQYRKVSRSAREGDVIVFTKNTAYVSVGKPYLVNEIDSADDAQITDDDGDDFDTCAKEFDVYEKVTEPSTKYREVKRKANVGERVRVFGHHDTSQNTEQAVIRVEDNGHIYYADGGRMPGGYVVLEPIAAPTAAYVEAKRKANVGERIKIVNRLFMSDPYETGDELTVSKRLDSERVSVDVGGRSAIVRDEEYVVLEPKPKRLTVGDYAKVIARGGNHNYEVDSVVRITEDDRTGAPYRAEKADGTVGNWLTEELVEPATEAEFLAQRKPAEPARLKVGDYAKVIDASGSGSAVLGDIVEVTHVRSASDPRDGDMVSVKTSAGDAYNMFSRRFTTATPEEVSEAQRKIEKAQAVGPFADGGFAQIVNATEDTASPTPRSTPNAFVRVEPTTLSRLRALKVTYVDGAFGYCNADALRQITEAEYNAAVAPEPKFSVGDSVKVTIADGERPRYGWGHVSNGDTGKVTNVSDVRITVDFPKQGGWDAEPGELTKLTAEEAAEAQETARWNAIGRKIGEYKTGDIVTSASYNGATKIVTAQIEDVGTELLGLRAADGEYHAVNKDGAKLVVPVEQRFDTEQAAEKAAA
ncbi:hypothetical protein NSS79_10475 [Paenibacillus sp. FSL L8-0436]|uniref:hypothetical protein n=1 Tax=Paenibacillus sp. FSL L8-0436 TaxID=2954686 RepID=UPI0031583F4A